MASQRGYEIVEQYTDRISGAKARRPGLNGLLRDARRGRFDVVLVWASDRIARSTKHFLECMVLRLNAREKLIDERKSASMYPAFGWR
jgi:DNA invertase Pin-like site-specific DNA recombinase